MIYKFKNLSKFGNIIHGISTKDFGTMKNPDNTINRDNLEDFLTNLSLPKNGVCMKQIHEGFVFVVSNVDNLLINNTDGLITSKKNIPICVVTADCLPILLFDQKLGIIGVAHGGRRGLESGIIERILKEFVNQFGSDPKEIIVGIGPGIEKSCYEVNGGFLDIRKIAVERLMTKGILMQNIESMDICTKDDKDFYSYRNGDKNNRFATIISLI